MKKARIYVDFNEMLEEDLVPLSSMDIMEDSKGNSIVLKEGLRVNIYSDDFSGCNQKDNLIADGIVELNNYAGNSNNVKWNCRINKAGIYNESQEV